MCNLQLSNIIFIESDIYLVAKWANLHIGGFRYVRIRLCGSCCMVASSMALFLPALSACAPAVRANGRHTRCAAVAPHSSSSSSSRGVDWVKSTDAEYFQDDTRPIMLFDGMYVSVLIIIVYPFPDLVMMDGHLGVCNLCNGGVRFVRDNDHNR